MDKKELKIGNNIQSWRKKKGLTQDALARKADMPYTTLAKIESNVIKGPSIHTVKKIAEALNVSLDDLMKND